MRDIIKKQQEYIDELESRLGAEIRMNEHLNEHLEKTLVSCENALLYKDDLLDKAYRKIRELVVESGL